MTHLKKSLLGLLLANPVSFSFAQENQYTQAENIKQATEYAKTFKGEFKEFPEFGLGQSTRYRILEKSGWTGPAQTQETSPKSISQVTPETGGGYPLPPIPFQFNAQVGQAVSKTLPFLAGAKSPKYSLQGKLPSGLLLNASTGVITGKPTLMGTYTFSVIQSSLSVPSQASVDITLNVTPETGGGYPLPPIPFQFNAQVGQAVSKTLPFLAGAKSPKYYLQGKLPSGLLLNASTGVITGKPTLMGTYTFSVIQSSLSVPSQASVDVTLSVTGITKPL